jgi:hypothetical protein
VKALALDPPSCCWITPARVTPARWPLCSASYDVIDREQAIAIVTTPQRGRLLIVADRANDDVAMQMQLPKTDRMDLMRATAASPGGGGPRTAKRLARYRFSFISTMSSTPTNTSPLTRRSRSPFANIDPAEAVPEHLRARVR